MVACVVAGTPVVLAQGPVRSDIHAGTYSCTDEQVVGFVHRPATSVWEPAAFAPASITLTLEHVEAFERESILEPGTMLDLSHYRASVTNERGLEMACRGSPTSELIEVATYGWVECTTAGVSYRFNFITDRYLKAQLSGYATPSDNATLDTPHIALGTCQRIE